jgi:acyl-homoserine lactone synthase
MEFNVVTSENAVLFTEALEGMYRLRHRIFVEKMGWEAIRKPDGIEKDQFDTPDAIYLILQDDSGAVIGSHRLLPTLKPHLFSELFANTCNVKGVQRAKNIYELNRTCVDEISLDKNQQNFARAMIMTGLAEFTAKAGIEYLTILTPLDVLFRYMLMGLEVKPLGTPREMDEVKQAAVTVKTGYPTLEMLRAGLGINGDILKFTGVANDHPYSEILDLGERPLSMAS